MGAQALRAERQRGVVLVTALFVLIAVLIAAVASARIALALQQSARGERDRHIALQAAEAALADAERDIAGGAHPLSVRATLFERGSVSGFAAGCGAGQRMPNLGLCLHLPAPYVPAWQRAPLHAPGVSVAYGSYTGAVMPTGAGSLPAQLPRYLIELLTAPPPGAAGGNLYRITAIGFGANARTRVVLQSYVQQADPSAPVPAAAHTGRLGWREIANWPDLHEAAK